MTENFWSDRFHWCAGGGIHGCQRGQVHDSDYCKRLADELFDEGAFKDRALRLLDD
jgi:hypothetical protein